MKKETISYITGMKSGSRERVRELIRIRDNHTCQICGKVWKEGQRRFDVHHKDCIKEKTKQCDNYEIEKDNLITLCHKCHLNLPEHKPITTFKPNYKLPNIYNFEDRNKEIFKLHQQNKTLSDISKIMKISRQRVSQILGKNSFLKG